MANRIRNRERLKRWLRRLINTPFDNRLETFVLSLMEIEGVKDLLLDFGRGKLLWFQVHIIVELTNLKSTLINSHIPEAVKSANSIKKQVSRSKYRQYLAKIDFNEPVNEVIRIGYVTAFHKLEGYRDQLVTLINERGRELDGKDVDITLYLKRVHKFKLDDLNNYPETIRRINWISNCVKHYRGYAKKKNPPASCIGMDSTKRIILSKEDLERDINFLIQFTSRLFSCAMLAVGCVRLEDMFDKSEAEEKIKLLPVILLLQSIIIVFLDTLKDETDKDFTRKWESFAENLPKYFKAHFASREKSQVGA